MITGAMAIMKNINHTIILIHYYNLESCLNEFPLNKRYKRGGGGGGGGDPTLFLSIFVHVHFGQNLVVLDKNEALFKNCVVCTTIVLL